MFRDIAKKVGPEPDHGQLAEDGQHARPDRRWSPDKFASLCKGKYAAEDSFRLVAYDSSIGTNGDWKTLTPVKDASGGKCAKAAS